MRRFLLCLLLLAGCGEQPASKTTSRIMMLGDSMFASNRLAGESVADRIEDALGEEVVDRSVFGARYFYGLPISGAAGLRLTAQPMAGDWDVIVVNGGGNDLLFGCGCGKCDDVLNRLISPDGRKGAIPAFVKSLRDTGAKVIYVGYLRNPGVNSSIKACGPAGNELDRRLAALDRLDQGMEFLALSDLVPNGDRSFHQEDLVHPSVKGSQAIGQRIARRVAALLPKP